MWKDAILGSRRDGKARANAQEQFEEIIPCRHDPNTVNPNTVVGDNGIFTTPPGNGIFTTPPGMCKTL